MAQQNNSNFTTIGNLRIRGIAARSQLVHAENYQGQELYEIGIANPQFEDPSSFPQDQQADYAKAIDSMKKRIKPAKDQYPATLWVKLPKYSRPDQNGNRRENHVIYLDASKKAQIPTQKEIANGTPITAIVNCFYIANNKNVEDYDGIAGRLRAIMLDKVTDSTWYDAQSNGLGIAGFTMLSDDEAFGTQSDNSSANDSNSSFAGNQNAQSNQNSNFGQNTQPNNNFSQNNADQQNGGMFGSNNQQNDQQNNNGNMFGSNNTNSQNPFGGQNNGNPFGGSNNQNNNGNPFNTPQNPQGNNGNPFSGQ